MLRLTLLLVLPVLSAQTIAGLDSPEKPKISVETGLTPTPLSTLELSEYKDLMLKAYELGMRILEAQRDKLQMELNALKAQAQLDEANADLTKRRNLLRDAHKAPEKLWELDEKYQWVPAKNAALVKGDK